MNVDMRRRSILCAGAALVPLVATGLASAETLPKIKVYRDPSCGCCGAWADHVRASGFTAEIIETDAMNQIKRKLGVPQSLASCHTAQVEDYVIEGHVPAVAIKRLLTERVRAKGLAVAGMPIGSAGMEIEGSAPNAYNVILFGDFGQKTFARFKGTAEIR